MLTITILTHPLQTLLLGMVATRLLEMALSGAASRLGGSAEGRVGKPGPLPIIAVTRKPCATVSRTG